MDHTFLVDTYASEQLKTLSVSLSVAGSLLAIATLLMPVLALAQGHAIVTPECAAPGGHS